MAPTLATCTVNAPAPRPASPVRCGQSGDWGQQESIVHSAFEADGVAALDVMNKVPAVQQFGG
jgi:hypothetical protein